MYGQYRGVPFCFRVLPSLSTGWSQVVHSLFRSFLPLGAGELERVASYRVKQNFLSHPQTVYKLSTGECSKHMTPVPCLSVRKVRPRRDGVDKKRLFVSVPQISLIDPRALNESV
jgi:hypothetical protein